MGDKNHEVFKRKLRFGMVGGGPGAFIGEVHRKAARMDGQMELVAGAFDINPDKSKQMGAQQYLDPKRTYGTYDEMIKGELALPREKRIDFVSITTPNNWHFPIAKAFLENGFHVICEKPMTMNVAEALELKKVVDKSGLVFALCHIYTGYPMVKLARDMVRGGDLGKIYKIVVQYPQGWLIRPIEKDGQMQASWRTDPKQSGAAGCMGDIGTHAENLAEYVSGLKVKEICADLTTFVEGRRLDDDGNCLVRYEGGAKGLLFASQISIGEENGLAIWVYGRDGALEWHQEHPNYVYVNRIDAPVEVWRRGNGYVAKKSPAAARGTRIPAGHPEGYLEAFANVFVNACDTMRCKIAGETPNPLMLDFPTVDDGVRGMRFIETVVESSRQGAVWVPMPK
ncbi:MAG: oxidoreductase [Lentisphaerae bacterium RIFOXYB12_FULL_65_16]|nr:MAG: oxidoreductase [Lentisphaerae bacterium RIFOXYA12_64_32]OGV84945.1 MAG: oxidoreductase [Lentisphaerae bacterium RIFOXYB12_FULL_65_16]